MDPPLISEGSFATANPSLAEIWPFNGNGRGGIGDMSGILGLRMGSGDLRLMAGLVDGSIEESTVTEQSASLAGGSGGRKRRAAGSEDESSKTLLNGGAATTSSGNELKESASKQMKLSGSKDENGASNSGTETSSAGGSKSSEKSKPPTEPPKDFIHVRARRGQATDSHSLAERARREKISERMKTLQDLVPGCNKVIGKALVLDEIINYIQSLQRQVEFLSMKLEAVNSEINPAISAFSSKDGQPFIKRDVSLVPFTPGLTAGPPAFDGAGMMFASQAGREYAPVMDAEWLHMHLGGGGGFDRST